MMHLSATRFLVAILAFTFVMGLTAKEYPPPAAPIPQVQAPSYSCPTGYVLEGSLCKTIIQEQPKAVCSWGSLQGDMCVQEYDAEPDCPPNFTLQKSRHSKSVAAARHHHTAHPKKKKSLYTPAPQGAKCSRTLTTPPLPQCPVGYTLDGLSCRRIKQLQPVCPSGSVQTPQGQCAYYKPTAKRCPPGYSPPLGHYHKSSAGAKCMKVSRVAADVVCNDAYTLSADRSQCELLTVLPPVCPPGAVEVSNAQCAYYKPVEKRCPTGYSADVGHHKKSSKHAVASPGCSRVISAEAFPVCQDGYSLDSTSGQCIKVTILPVVCPPRTREVGGSCVTYTPAEPQCPPDYTMSDSHHKKSKRDRVCVKTVSVAATPYCSPGYSLEGNQCVKFVANPPVCPPGTVEDSVNECVVYSSPQSQCPPGFEQSRRQHGGKSHHGKGKVYENKCVQVQSVAPLVACSKEFTLTSQEGTCEKVVATLATTVCKQGARQGDSCVTYTPVPAQYNCPGGYELQGGRCVQMVEYDCSTVEYVTKCQEEAPCVGKECELNYVSHKLRSLKKADEGHLYKPTLYKKGHKSTPTSRICEKVAVPRAKACQKPLYADAMFACPSNSQAQGKECVVPEYSAADVVCHDGLTLQGTQCVKTLRKAADYSCPPGFDMSSSSHSFKSKHTSYPSSRTCVKTTEVDLEYYCADGQLVNNSRCAKYFSKQCPNGECERRVVLSADYQCGVGFSLTSSSHKSKRAMQPTCVLTETVPVSYYCAVGELQPDSASCAQYFPKECPEGGCERTSAISPFYQCPAGYDNNSHSKGKHHSKKMSCTSVEQAPFEHFCSKGESVLEGERCVTYVAKQCPAGGCERTSRIAVDYQCPAGFELQRAAAMKASKSSKKHMKSKSTSYPQDMSSPTCFSTDFADFDHYCTKGEMVVGGDRCATYIEKTCPNGQCQVMETASPNNVCPEGYQMPSSHGHVSYKKGSYRKGSHHQNSGVVLCQAVEVADPLYRCEKGMMNPSGTRCIKTANVEYVCPTQGATLASDGSCSITKYEKPIQANYQKASYQKPAKSYHHYQNQHHRSS